MHVYRSKRDLASASSESISYSSFSDSTAHRFQHGHQHDHLHGQYRGRGLNNSNHAVLSTASGPPALSDTNGVAATVAGTSGAASLSEHLVEQSATSEPNAAPLADGQDISHKGKITVPQSLLEDQPAASQDTPAYSGSSSTSKIAADADTRSIWQQQYSTAERVSLFVETSSVLPVVVFCLWVFFFATMYD